MNTDFQIVSASTVSSSFRWNGEYPSLTSVADNTTSYISGYAPGLSVCFVNNSIINSGNTTFYWNFGDYYNQSTNTITEETSSLSIVHHNYVMPGVYNVSLTHYNEPSGTCDVWYWDKLISSEEPSYRITWDNTKCLGSNPRKWKSQNACKGKYCISWSWTNLESESENFLTWKEISNNGPKTVTWRETKISDDECGSTYGTSQTLLSTHIIEVKEILPVAILKCSVVTPSGVSPYTVELSPTATVCGSFPIDRIVWDFGDGTGLKTVSRYGTPEEEFVRVNKFETDFYDPRNYKAVHTYRNEGVYMFYPSITAYSMNTNSYDVSRVVVGPVVTPSVSSDIKLVKVRNNKSRNVYGVQIGNNFTVIATNKP